MKAIEIKKSRYVVKIQRTKKRKIADCAFEQLDIERYYLSDSLRNDVHVFYLLFLLKQADEMPVDDITSCYTRLAIKNSSKITHKQGSNNDLRTTRESEASSVLTDLVFFLSLSQTRDYSFIFRMKLTWYIISRSVYFSTNTLFERHECDKK